LLISKEKSFKFAGRKLRFDPSSVEPPLLNKKCYKPTAFALDVSGRCNLKCAYCFEGKTQPLRPAFSQRTLIKAIEFLFNHSDPQRPVSFHFGSGEPLLESELIRFAGTKIKELAQSMDRNYSLHLTTNGTLITKEIIDWLIDDDWSIKISLDGGAEIHDIYRKDSAGHPTHGVIAEQVRTLALAIPEKLVINAVLTHRIKSSRVFDEIADLGVKYIELLPVIQMLPSPFVQNEEDIADYKEFLIQYTQRIAGGESVPVLKNFLNRLFRIMGFDNKRMSCGAGRDFFGIGADGLIFPCFRFVGLPDFQLGNINSGLSQSRMRWFTDNYGLTYENWDSCKACWVAPMCGGPCFSVMEFMEYTPGPPPIGYCGMVQADCEAAVWLIDVLKDKHSEYLFQFIGLNEDEL